MIAKVPPTARLEIKFAAYETQLDLVRNWLRVHAAGFCVPHPNRWVNNVYTDTHDYRAFVDNLSGMSARSKVRYRWYGESRMPDVGVLEVKLRRNFFGWKRRFAVESAPYHEGADWAVIRRNIASELPAEGRRWLEESPFPILSNRYYRRYYLSRDSLVRATIDTHQAFWDQRRSRFPNLTQKANLPRSLVVEFKFAREDRERAVDVLQGFPIRVSRHSKYINGVRFISGE